MSRNYRIFGGEQITIRLDLVPGYIWRSEHHDFANLPDPWVIAWTLVEDQRLKGELFGGECLAVSSEGTRTNHIAEVCAKEGVRCVTLQAMLGLEGLKFARS